MSGLYQKLLQFAVVTFSPKDILGFLGRKWDRRFDGNVQTEVKTDRLLGTRIKHRMTRNWLKMYDKFGLILRVETVINRPREFSVYRSRFHRDGTSSQGYFPMNKDTGSLILYQEQALACNRRYLDALAVVDVFEEQEQVAQADQRVGAVRRSGQRVRAAVHVADHVNSHVTTVGWPGGKIVTGNDERPP